MLTIGYGNIGACRDYAGKGDRRNGLEDIATGDPIDYPKILHV